MAAMAAAFALAGAVFCFLGYAVPRIWGSSAGLALGAWAWSLVSGGWAPALCLALGAMLAMALFRWPRIGIAAAGALSGFVMALLALYTAGDGGWPLALGGAAVGGACCALLPGRFLIPVSSLGGAASLVLSIAALGQGSWRLLPPRPALIGPAAGSLLLAVLLTAASGAAVQRALYRRRQRVDGEFR